MNKSMIVHVIFHLIVSIICLTVLIGTCALAEVKYSTEPTAQLMTPKDVHCRPKDPCHVK